MVNIAKETFSVRYMSDLPYSLSLDGSVDIKHNVLYNAENFKSEEEAFDWVKKNFKEKKMKAPHFFIDKFTVAEDGTEKAEYGKAQYIGRILSDNDFQDFCEDAKSMGLGYDVLGPVHQHEDLKKKYPWFDAPVKGYVLSGKVEAAIYPFYEGESVWDSNFNKIFPVENDFEKAEEKLRKKGQEDVNANVGAKLSLGNDR